MNAVDSERPMHVQKFQSYAVDAELGRGAHGTVFRATANNGATLVALKVIPRRQGSDRQLLESLILSQLQHRHIVKFIDSFVEDSNIVLALEYISGGNLESYLRSHSNCGPKLVIKFLSQMSAALSHAHKLNILHRDIKPANILLRAVVDSEDFDFVLTDFGISRISDQISRKPAHGGTYLYMAPEQLLGRPTQQSDLWSLGIVAFRMLFGRLPFQGETVESLAEAINHQIPQGDPALSIQPDLLRIVFSLLEKRLENRVTAADQLKELVDKLPGEARVSDHEISSAAANFITPPLWEDRVKRQHRLNRNAMIALAIIICFLRGAISIFALLAARVIYHDTRLYRRIAVAPRISFPAFFVMLVGFVVSYVYWRNLDEGSAKGLAIITGIVGVAIVPLFIFFLFRYLNTSRQLEIWRLFQRRDTDIEIVQKNLIEYCASHRKDISLRHMLIDWFIARGKINEAIAELMIIKEHDPYNYYTNLALAQCYFYKGLFEKALVVCEVYRNAASHCFEFNHIKTQCEQRLRMTSLTGKDHAVRN